MKISPKVLHAACARALPALSKDSKERRWTHLVLDPGRGVVAAYGPSAMVECAIPPDPTWQRPVLVPPALAACLAQADPKLGDVDVTQPSGKDGQLQRSVVVRAGG